MKLSKTQHMLLRITMSLPRECRGLFYPHDRMWDPKVQEHVPIHGAGIANAIHALKRQGLAIDGVPHVKYSFQLTPETMAAFEKGEITEA